MSVTEQLLDEGIVPSGWSGDLSLLETQELVSRIKEGDGQAFATLYRTYVSTVHRYVARRTDPSRVEDIVAEVFVRALKHIQKFEFRGQEVSAWLIRIARNLLLDQLRSASNRREVLHDETPEVVDDELERTVLSILDAEAIRTALSSLRPEHQTVLDFRFLKGYSGYETAEAMDRTEGAVRVLQYRALRALKKELELGKLSMHLEAV